MLAFAGNITGTVVDGGDKSVLAQCTVRLLMARDSAFVKGVASDADGKFSFSGVKNGKYVLQFSFIGYETLNKEVSVTSSAPAMRTKCLLFSMPARGAEAESLMRYGFLSNPVHV